MIDVRKSPRLAFYAGVFLLALSTLALEIVQTRILSVVAWYHLAFFVISLAMFGLTAGAVWVYLRGDRFNGQTLSDDLAGMTAAFALSTVASICLQTVLTPVFVSSISGLVALTVLSLCMAAPYFFAGVAMSLALTRSPFPVPRVYGVDLIGAATGCLAALLLLSWTDGLSAVLWIGTLAAVAAVAFAAAGIGGVPVRSHPFWALVRRRPMIVLLLAAFALFNGMIDNGLKPLLVKNKVEAFGPETLHEEWNSFSRIVVQQSDDGKPQMWGPSPLLRDDQWKVEKRYLTIDGDAGTSMYRYTGDDAAVGFLKYDVTNLAYALPGRERGAVIGVGGGRDLLSAHIFGVRDVTGVEVNPVFVRLLTQTPGFTDYAGLAALPGMHLVVDEARSWFARTSETFDIIQMSLIDTWAATGAGAFTLSENGLYTVDAWRIFLDRLTPTGVYTVSRWHQTNKYDETGRMVSLAMAALMEMGVPEPRRHIFVASSGRIATLVLARSPFSAADLAALEAATAQYGFKVLVSPDGAPASEVLGHITAARSLHGLHQYTASLALDLTPPTDDRPFFFNQVPIFKVLAASRAIGAGKVGGVAAGNLTATFSLAGLFLVSTMLVIATILVPLRSTVVHVGRRLIAGGTAYFLLIGMGFMLVEIALLQRFSVFLGHPTYSLSVVLFTVILSTGLGSLISDRLPLDSRLRLAAWSVMTAVYIMLLPAWLPGVLRAFDDAPLLTRAAIAVATLTPAGVLMGFGFPTGMRLIGAVDRRPTPWFWGINGAAGVTASVIAVACSISFGIHLTLAIGGLCYFMLMPAAFLIGAAAQERADAELPIASGAIERA